MIALIIIIAIIVVLVVWFVSIYNGIVRKDNRCDNAWQTIDAQLQRRNDLIPNLVETVKSYAAHELRRRVPPSCPPRRPRTRWPPPTCSRTR